MHSQQVRGNGVRVPASLSAMALALAAGMAAAQTAPPAAPLQGETSEGVPPPPGLLSPSIVVAPAEAGPPATAIPPPAVPAQPVAPLQDAAPAVPGPAAYQDLSPSQVEEQRTAEALAREQMTGADAGSAAAPGTPQAQPARPAPVHGVRHRHAHHHHHHATSATASPGATQPSDYWKGVPQSRAGAAHPGLVSQDLPPLPVGNPNACFALVQQPGRYAYAQHSYTLVPSADRLTLVPPVVASGTQDIHVRDAGEVVAVLPAHERYETQRVQIAPASVRYVRSDSTYQEATRRMQTQPARIIWAPGPGKVEWTDPDTGEVFHRVKQQARYETMTRQVEEQPGELHAVVVPAQYTTVTRRVIDRPARILRAAEPGQDVPAPVRDVIEPGIAGRVATRPVDAAYTSRQQLQAPGVEWRAVVCEAQLTPSLVAQVQAALGAAGYPVATASGRFDADTRHALNAFQRANGLPQDAYLNLDTVRALGVPEPDTAPGIAPAP